MTAIPPAIHSRVPEWIFSLSSLGWEGINASTSAAEALFYNSIRGGVVQASRVVKWMRGTSISRIHEIQGLFNMANAALVVFYSHKLVSEVHNKFQFAILAGSMYPVSVIVVAGVVCVAAWVILKYATEAPPLPELDQEVTISQSESTQQKIGKPLQVAKIVLSCALSLFAKNYFLLAIGLIGSGYSLLRNCEIKWIKFSKHFPLSFVTPAVRGATISYNMLAVPKDASSDTECSICRDSESEVDMAFCANHLFHRKCIGSWVAAKSKELICGAHFRRIDTPQYINGVHTHTTHDYSVTIPEGNLPTCPTCRERPLQNGCDIEVQDADYGTFNASVTISREKDSQNLFEQLYAAYNVGQAGLASLQQYPELASAIYKIQQVMAVTDVLGLLGTMYYLHKRVKEKIGPSPIKYSVAALTALAALAATTAFSLGAVSQINAYLKPAFALKKLLAELEISPNLLKNIDVQWDSTSKLQALYLMRMTASIALSFFSKQRVVNLLSAAAQMVSLGAISRLRWIKFTQTHPDPSLGRWQSLQEVTIESDFLVAPACVQEPHHAKAALKSIYTMMSRILDKSRWSRYWMVDKLQGVEVGKRLRYSVELRKIPSVLCECNLDVDRVTLFMKGIDEFQGRVLVDVH